MRKNKRDEWWRSAVIYQIYVRSFSDSSGDGIGDLRGIINNLDYVADLGVDALWLTPFMKSPMKDFGYDVSDFRQVDPLFGTEADLEELIAVAHDKKLKMVIDVVLSHTSNKHAWFEESRSSKDNDKADWYTWVDPGEDGSMPNNWLARFGGPAWTFEPRRGQYYYHGFSAEQPDLNYHNPDVQDAILAEIKYWLDMGIDGLRLDACNHFFQDDQLRSNPPAERKGKPIAEPYEMQAHKYDRTQPENIRFLKRLRALTDEYEGRFIVAEVGDDNGIRTSAAYVDTPDLLHTAYCFSMLINSPYNADVFRGSIEEFNGYTEQGWPSWSISNHDAVRPMTRWGGKENANNPALARQLQALFLCLRGTLFIYQGQELGLTEAVIPPELMQDPLGIKMYPIVESRDGSRTPLPWKNEQVRGGFTPGIAPWLPIPEGHLMASIETQEKNERSVLTYTRQFLRWRKKNKAILLGDISFMDAPKEFLAFERRLDGESIVCIFSLVAGTAILDKNIYFTEECDPIVPENERPSVVEGGMKFPPYGFLIHKHKK